MSDLGNNLSINDFKVGTIVEWAYSPIRKVEGEVQGISGNSLTIQWKDEPINRTFEYRYSDSSLSIQTSPEMELRITKDNKDSTEDKLKDIIIYLVQVNQTELACDTIVVLQKYKHNLQALEFIERST